MYSDTLVMVVSVLYLGKAVRFSKETRGAISRGLVPEPLTRQKKLVVSNIKEKISKYTHQSMCDTWENAERRQYKD